MEPYMPMVDAYIPGPTQPETRPKIRETRINGVFRRTIRAAQCRDSGLFRLILGVCRLSVCAALCGTCVGGSFARYVGPRIGFELVTCAHVGAHMPSAPRAAPPRMKKAGNHTRLPAHSGHISLPDQ